MSLLIDDYQNITIFKQDTGSFTVGYQVDGQDISFETGDTVRMTVKKSGESTNLFEKEITSFVDGKAIISISSDDSNNASGVYQYKIKIELANGQKHTIIPSICDGTNPTFKICGE